MRISPNRKAIAFCLVIATLVAVSCTASKGGGGSSSQGGSSAPSGPVTITLWHGYQESSRPGATPNYEQISLEKLVAEFEKTHPNITVNVVYCCNNDLALRKLTVALQGNKQPDIAYEYGSSMPQLATAPKVLDLTSRIQNDPSYNWNDFWPGERAAATVNGHILGVPALVDNLAVVYNKDLFDKANLPYPTPQWTWDQFRADAKALTNASTEQFGWSYPMSNDEDTVWHYDAMLWEGNGNILNADNTKAAFNEQPGVQALTALQQMAVTDKSVYLDYQNNGKATDLFNSGRIGMQVTGPWDLPSFPDVNYGVQVMPSFPGGTHESISGPDNWVLFDNGSARSAAAWEFAKWLTSPAQILQDSLFSGHLPTRASVEKMPGFSQLDKKFPGEGVFAANLANVKKARPVLTTYPQISDAMALAIVQVMSGKEPDPQTALNNAATRVNSVLSIPA